MSGWLEAQAPWVWWVAGSSVVTFFATLLAIPLIISRLRSDYFVERHPAPETWTGRHRTLGVIGRVLKNLAGFVFVLAGILMLVLPGQGVLTILVGVMLLDFPGKRGFELRIVRQRHVRRGIDWIRKKAGRPPLQIPERSDRPG